MSKRMYGTSTNELIATPVPTGTSSYKPISHQELIEFTLDSIRQAGFNLCSETYTSAREGRVANARYVISNVADNEMQLQIGWQNSYDKTLSLKFAAGSRIIICSNGMVVGDLGAFKSKHVGEVQVLTPQKIREGILAGGEVFEAAQRDRDRLKEIELTKRVTAELIGRLYIEETIINSEQLNIVREELKHPSFDYKAGDTAWNLYNHCTLALKNAHPEDYFSKHTRLHNFFTNEFLLN